MEVNWFNWSPKGKQKKRVGWKKEVKSRVGFRFCRRFRRPTIFFFIPPTISPHACERLFLVFLFLSANRGWKILRSPTFSRATCVWELEQSTQDVYDGEVLCVFLSHRARKSLLTMPTHVALSSLASIRGQEFRYEIYFHSTRLGSLFHLTGNMEISWRTF